MSFVEKGVVLRADSKTTGSLLATIPVDVVRNAPIRWGVRYHCEIQNDGAVRFTPSPFGSFVTTRCGSATVIRLPKYVVESARLLKGLRITWEILPEHQLQFRLLSTPHNEVSVLQAELHLLRSENERLRAKLTHLLPNWEERFF